MNEQPLRIHQALSGYQDGHRILGASLVLSPQDQRTLLAMSDMSGPRMVPGFETYLTGYPLRDAGYFVFARTWYAPEMERPGCVWTHSLLIPFDCIGLPTLSALIGFFQRPSVGEDGRYRKPIVVSSDARHAPSLPNMSRDLAVSFFTDEGPLLRTAPTAAHLESSVVAIWDLLWPRLRQVTTFCTGALQERFLNGSPLSIQVLPQSARSTTSTSPSLSPSTIPFPPEWLFSPPEDVRRFLWDWGEDLPEKKTSYPALCRIFHTLQHDPAEAVAVVAREAPQPAAARTLKAALFEGQKKRHWPKVASESHQILLSLVQASAAVERAFQQAVEPSKLAQAIWSDRPRDKARALILDLSSCPLNALGEQVLRSALLHAPQDELANLANARPELVGSILAEHPELAATPALWSGPYPLGATFLRLLAKSPAHATLQIDKLARAMVQAERHDLVEDAVRYLGDGSVRAFLQALDAEGREGSDWLQVLGHYPHDVLTWLLDQTAVSSSLAKAIVLKLDPTSSVVVEGTDAFAKAAFSISANEMDAELAARMVAVGLQGAGAEGPKLATATFHVVHAALANGHLSGKAWRYLDDVMPRLAWYLEWDRCERLRRSWARAFVKQDWPVSLLADLQLDDQSAERVIAQIAGSRDGSAKLEAALKERRHAQLPKAIQAAIRRVL